ncbi:transmembrane protein, putative (macronuclear) [Tetrahymena thermophila SB210]|uniref:Transmembrane protein, putative n=1 Tax=Tetrahymena thermophila (strain SB210) TaxID=312017 RepID=W7XHY4_TETTS|nr:transmembrane protein, putative [Tetrahymena thermophila SB210]EWS74171.1 transmembrane protein, putative [Tetrahymena thermophila SB210]|eukprot:XP_012653292.1 transmembrane protein, putative [Tetrahymena thermophila SB210]
MNARVFNLITFIKNEVYIYESFYFLCLLINIPIYIFIGIFCKRNIQSLNIPLQILFQKQIKQILLNKFNKLSFNFSANWKIISKSNQIENFQKIWRTDTIIKKLQKTKKKQNKIHQQKITYKQDKHIYIGFCNQNRILKLEDILKIYIQQIQQEILQSLIVIFINRYFESFIANKNKIQGENTLRIFYFIKEKFIIKKKIFFKLKVIEIKQQNIQKKNSEKLIHISLVKIYNL